MRLAFLAAKSIRVLLDRVVAVGIAWMYWPIAEQTHESTEKCGHGCG
jgi:hypothetical protein